MKAAWHEYLHRIKNREGDSNLRIGVAASFTANPLLPFIGAPLVEAGLNPVIELAPYNQLFQVCFNYKETFPNDCSVLILLYRLEDLALEEMTAFLHGDAGAFQRAVNKIDSLVSALAGLRAVFPGTIIVNLPPYPVALPVHPLSLENPLGLGSLHRALTTEFLARVESIKGLRLLDLDAVQRECGLSSSSDPRQWYLYRQPFAEPFLLETGILLARMVAATRKPPKKCIVLDCDNTLWGGVIGEDGMAGIQLGDEFPGTAYRDFQRLLLYLRQRGVLLALASKNNEADVWEVFDKHSGMLLKREHISAWQINWNPKSDNIPQIAKALNIGLDSLVFIDDNPMEIDYMRSAVPEVHSVLLPEEPADILSHIRQLTLFDRLEITREDSQRADMMQAERQRETLGKNLTKEDFLRSLELRIDFFRAAEEDLERITQLINKTNQFNLTTIRRSLDEVRSMAGLPKYRIYGLRVSDKFGDYGLTGAVIAEISDDRAQWTIDTLLLSCRVLGRGVETALLAELATQAKDQGARELIASFIPSAKNAIALSFLPDHGFQHGDDGRWQIDVAKILNASPSAASVRPESAPEPSPDILR
jgi:FkbH-like protein